LIQAKATRAFVGSPTPSACYSLVTAHPHPPVAFPEPEGTPLTLIHVLIALYRGQKRVEKGTEISAVVKLNIQMKMAGRPRTINLSARKREMTSPFLLLFAAHAVETDP